MGPSDEPSPESSGATAQTESATRPAFADRCGKTHDEQSAPGASPREDDASQKKVHEGGSKNDLLRVAIVQLTTHPAAVINGHDYLAEPFLPHGDEPLALASLRDKYKNVAAASRVTELQRYCREEYLRWSKVRLQAVCDYFKRFGSTSGAQTKPERRPDVIVFAEYGVPFEHLDVMKDLAKQTGAIVVAGTHAFPSRTEANVTKYRNLGIDFDKLAIEANEQGNRHECVSVLVVFGRDPKTDDQIIGKARVKRRLSVFELSDVGSLEMREDDREYESWTFGLTNRQKKLSIQTIVCSEALQRPKLDEDFELLVVPALNGSGEPFSPEIRRNTSNKSAVVFCNGGHYGGSCISITKDRRISNWWLVDSQPTGQLPPGDCVLIGDLTYKRLAPESVVANPNLSFVLKRLIAVLPDHDDSSPCRVAKQMKSLREKAINDWNDNQVKKEEIADELRGWLHSERPTELQRLKIERLQTLNAEHGASGITPQQWIIFGDDILYGGENSEQGKATSSGESQETPCAQNHPASPDNIDLTGLERRLAKQCLEVITTFDSTGMPSSQAGRPNRRGEGETDQLSVVRNLLAARVGISPLVDVEQQLWQSLGKMKDGARWRAERELTQRVAAIVERFKATAAWLYVDVSEDPRTDGSKDPTKTGRRRLRLVVAQNARRNPEFLNVELNVQQRVDRESEQEDCQSKKYDSMTAKAFGDQKYVLYSAVETRRTVASREPFMSVKSDTRSALSVPIFAPACAFLSSEELMKVLDAGSSEPLSSLPDAPIGVLTLESNQPYRFVNIDAAALMVEVRQLATDLVVLRDTFSTMSQLAWRPQDNQWSVSDALSELLFGVCTSSADSRNTPAFGATVWYADHDSLVQPEPSKVRGGFALASIRFDPDYLEDDVLPFYEQIEEDGKVKFNSKSVIGAVIIDNQYKPPKDWRDEKLFQRLDKAERTELRELVAAPFGNWSIKGIDGSSRHLALGALSVYFYQDEFLSSRLPATRLFDHESTQRLANLVGRFVDEAFGALIRTALTRLQERLFRESVTKVNVFNIVRDVVMEIFDADGCSIYAVERTPPKDNSGLTHYLECVSTSGISCQGVEVGEHDDRARYNLAGVIRGRKDLQLNGEATAQLGLDPPTSANPELRSVRRNWDTRKLDDIKNDRKIESFVLSDVEHRRFMATQVLEPDPDAPSKWRTAGVIRLVRSCQRSPFLHYDEALLRWIGVVASQAFAHRFGADRKHEEASMTAAVRCASYFAQQLVDGPPTTAASASGAKPSPVSKPDVKEKVIRLFTPLTGFAQYSRGRVDAILRDLFACLLPLGVTRVSLRFVCRSARGNRELRIWSLHSQHALGLHDDHRSEAVSESLGSIGWLAIEQGRPVQALGRDPMNRHIVPAQDKETSRHSLSFPLLLNLDGYPQRGVLSVDFQDSSAPEAELLTKIGEEEIQLMMAAARALERLGGTMAAPESGSAKLSPAWEQWGNKKTDEKAAHLVEELLADWEEKRRMGKWCPPGLDFPDKEALRALRVNTSLQLSAEFVGDDGATREQLGRSRRSAFDPFRSALARHGYDPKGNERLDPRDEDLVFYCEEAGIEVDLEKRTLTVPLRVSALDMFRLVGTLELKKEQSYGHEPTTLRVLLKDALMLWNYWMCNHAAPDRFDEGTVSFSFRPSGSQPAPTRRYWEYSLSTGTREPLPSTEEGAKVKGMKPANEGRREQRVGKKRKG